MSWAVPSNDLDQSEQTILCFMRQQVPQLQAVLVKLARPLSIYNI